jgi:hypothetical protein
MTTFTCHTVEWFEGDTCLGCQAAKEERQRILTMLLEKKLLRESMVERDWFVGLSMVDTGESWWKPIDVPRDLWATQEVTK